MAVLSFRTQIQYYKYEINGPYNISVDDTFGKEYKYNKLPKGIASIYVYEDTGQETDFDATTQLGVLDLYLPT